MAEEQKVVEVPKEEVAAAPAAEPVAEPAVETKAEETPAPAATEAAAETAPEVAAEPAAAAEDKKEEEVKPVDEGTLDHKGQGANFPKNLFPSKKFFWLGSDPVDLKAIPSFKADKAVDVAHHVAAWASETGKGLLFYSEKSDKAAPHGAIHLAEASDPVNEGTNKFHFAVKGHKHTFKAATTAERDGWVAQLKTKIAEAKELAATVTESETYKKTMESFKPAKKEEKAAAPTPAAEPAATEEAAAPAATEETPAAEPAAEDKKEEPKRRSASRKRASVFGGLFGKKEEAKAVEAPAAEAEPATEAAAETPAAETTETPAAAEAEAAAAPAEEAKPEEKKEEAHKEVKPKRQSIFGGLSFNKKKAAEPAPAVEEAAAATEPVADVAPVIPSVETTEPLSTEVAAAAPAETTEAEPAAPATNGETPKKEVKSEKRKSSLPFGLGAKKEKPTSEDEGEKVKSPSAFSKLRGTFKGKGKAEKAAEKTEEVPAVPATDAAAAEASTEAAPAVEAAPEATPAAPAVEEPVAKPVETTPAVTAAA